MYFNENMILEAEKCYGTPALLRLNYPTPRAHYDFIRSTQKNGRAHDITLYLYHCNRLAVTRKPPYPLGAYRPPSGGLKPGETLEEGARREGLEELGIPVALDKYLLRVRVDFVCEDLRAPGDRIPWTTHVFRVGWEGRPMIGKVIPARAEVIPACPESDLPILNPQDKHEIAEARWADEAEFFGPMRRGLLAMGSTGLLYRAHLHDVVWRKWGWG